MRFASAFYEGQRTRVALGKQIVIPYREGCWPKIDISNREPNRTRLTRHARADDLTAMQPFSRMSSPCSEDRPIPVRCRHSM